MTTLVIENLTKAFRQADCIATAVDEFSVTLQDNEFIVLVGPSGCGKTTLLRLIAGLEKPDAGTIKLDGTALNAVPASERDMAMVFQSPALFPHMTVFENLAFGLKLRKTASLDIKRRVADAAEVLGITPRLECKPQELSGGEAQRVALGRALLRQPKTLLLDEPLSSLDPPTRRQLRAEIIRLHARVNAPAIYVTHDHHEAFSMPYRIAVMHQGRLQQVGSADELRSKPANQFVAEFLETDPAAG